MYFTFGDDFERVIPANSERGEIRLHVQEGWIHEPAMKRGAPDICTPCSMVIGNEESPYVVGVKYRVSAKNFVVDEYSRLKFVTRAPLVPFDADEKKKLDEATRSTSTPTAPQADAPKSLSERARVA